MQSAADASCACPVVVDAGSTSLTTAPPPVPRVVEPTTHAPHVLPLAVCDARGLTPLDAARAFADSLQWEAALSCAAQAAALAPSDVLAHVEKANALSALGRFDEARLSVARALAHDPDSLDALLAAAHLYALALPSSRENDELGSAYAEHGFDLAAQAREEDTEVAFARLSAMAFNDLGQSGEALDRASWVLEKVRHDPEAAFERAVALFELCRFTEARQAFEGLLGDQERAPHVHHHLGLLLERDGHVADAEVHFAKSRALAPADFPAPVILSAAEFRAQVDATVASLPADMRRDLAGVPVAVEDLPQAADLTAGDPPLSPTILGLFRGPSLKESCDAEPDAGAGVPCRSIALYRKNLGRAVKTREELDEQIRVTLLHEVGHLRGEDDFELAARGLE